MKVEKWELKQQPPYLYIPHGSDERPFTGLKKANNIGLYIPHGSDESRQ